jgi:hypothetical protein
VIDEVRRRFGDDDVARIEQRFAEQIEELLRAGGDNDVVRAETDAARREPVEREHVAEDLVAQRRVALRGAVLQGGLRGGRIAQDLVDRGTHFVGRQRLGIDQTRGEADEVRVLHALLHEPADRLLAGLVATRGELQRCGHRRSPVLPQAA